MINIGGGAENSTYHEAVVQDVNGARFDLVDDEKQQQRDEVDELFHNGSQKQDVAGIITNINDCESEITS